MSAARRTVRDSALRRLAALTDSGAVATRRSQPPTWRPRSGAGAAFATRRVPRHPGSQCTAARRCRVPSGEVGPSHLLRVPTTACPGGGDWNRLCLAESSHDDQRAHTAPAPRGTFSLCWLPQREQLMEHITDPWLRATVVTGHRARSSRVRTTLSTAVPNVTSWSRSRRHTRSDCGNPTVSDHQHHALKVPRPGIWPTPSTSPVREPQLRARQGGALPGNARHTRSQLRGLILVMSTGDGGDLFEHTPGMLRLAPVRRRTRGCPCVRRPCHSSARSRAAVRPAQARSRPARAHGGHHPWRDRPCR